MKNTVVTIARAKLVEYLSVFRNISKLVIMIEMVCVCAFRNVCVCVRVYNALVGVCVCIFVYVCGIVYNIIISFVS